MLVRALFLFSLLGCLWGNPVFALDVPEHSSPVVDLAGVLSTGDQAKIASSLLQFQQKYGPQLQVLVVPSLEDESIESYSIKVVDKWKLGSKEKDDGVLLLVATENRKVRIEVGRGLEGVLPDVIAGRIIRTGIIPFFKQGQTGAGILVGLGMIAESVGGKLEDVPAPRLHKIERSSGGLGYLLFIGLFLIGPLFARRRRGGVGSALLSALLMGAAMSGGRRGGGGGFGGGGGGFGGGGGGGFSGGGASGGW